MQTEEEIRQEGPMEKMPTEAPEAPAVSEERTNKGKRKRGVLIKTREEAPAARQEEENSENPFETNTFTFADNEGQNEENPMDFSIPLASSPLMQNRTFREQGESSRGA